MTSSRSRMDRHARLLAAALPLALFACDETAGVPSFGGLPDATAAPDAGDAGLTPGCTPRAEMCNWLDDDCDGRIDEDVTGSGDACPGTAEGSCTPGVRTCVGGQWTCAGAMTPTPERCNGLDDDCDGLIDETPTDAGASCVLSDNATGRMTCQGGALVCAEHSGATCADRPERGRACGSDVGACQVGALECEGESLRCIGETGPATEVCNGLDDDCDGTIDEAPSDVGEACGEVGECGPGRTICQAGVVACAPTGAEAVKVCDGIDNDCDDQIDEADPRAGEACGLDVGACSPGELRCVGAQLICFGGTGPVPEVCDGRDNDCDGRVDESGPDGQPCPQGGDTCMRGADCASGLCYDDLGQRYCSANCGEGEPCPDGLVCANRFDRQLCVRPFPPCLSESDCPAGQHCQMVPARAVDQFGGECRPALPGAAVGGACEGERPACQTGLCLRRVSHCTALCRGPAECPAEMVCVLTPFVLQNEEIIDLGLCYRACEIAENCGGEDLVCHYGQRADRDAVIGWCDEAYEGPATGEPCDDMQVCREGFCRRIGEERYCTRGCSVDAHCPDTWTCEERQIGDRGLTIGICLRP